MLWPAAFLLGNPHGETKPPWYGVSESLHGIVQAQREAVSAAGDGWQIRLPHARRKDASWAGTSAVSEWALQQVPARADARSLSRGRAGQRAPGAPGRSGADRQSIARCSETGRYRRVVSDLGPTAGCGYESRDRPGDRRSHRDSVCDQPHQETRQRWRGRLGGVVRCADVGSRAQGSRRIRTQAPGRSAADDRRGSGHGGHGVAHRGGASSCP